MTLIAFELSGETPDIPAAEIIGALKSENIDFSVYDHFDQLLIIDVTSIDPAIMDSISGRLALTWHTIEVLGICGSSISQIKYMVRDLKFPIPVSVTYRIRVKKIKGIGNESSEDIERSIGGVLFNKGYRADLEDPDVQYRAVLSDGKCIFGRVIHSVDRGAFEKRNPQKKPFFYPGVLMPRLARALVNIAGANCRRTVLDPYCGTGGILVEAGLIGAEVIGCDVQTRILMGAKMNLDFYSLNYSLILQDAADMALADGCVDCIVTDPPYGRSALIQARSLNSLMERSINEMYRVLCSGGRAVVVTEIPIEEWAGQSGFTVAATYIQRVHRSLTRRITVLDRT